VQRPPPPSMANVIFAPCLKAASIFWAIVRPATVLQLPSKNTSLFAISVRAASLHFASVPLYRLPFPKIVPTTSGGGHPDDPAA